MKTYIIPSRVEKFSYLAVTSVTCLNLGGLSGNKGGNRLVTPVTDYYIQEEIYENKILQKV